MQCFHAMSDMGVASSGSNYFDFRHQWYSLVPWNVSMSLQVFCIVTTVTFIFKEIKSNTIWPKITSDSYIQTVQWIMELSFICFRPILQTEYPQQNFIGSVLSCKVGSESAVYRDRISRFMCRVVIMLGRHVHRWGVLPCRMIWTVLQHSFQALQVLWCSHCLWACFFFLSCTEPVSSIIFRI